jgi:leucyl/phenylalanyl-tRNA--protein transferase
VQLPILDPSRPTEPFPTVESALIDPDGLLAMGGCLSSSRLINAYQLGIFPWYNPGEPILWWSPNPRLVLFPENLKISRSLAKTIRRDRFKITFDTAFAQVMQYCAAPRSEEMGTWISEEIFHAYTTLHSQGVAHSVEAWLGEELVGGLYGVAMGQVFFGESMFHRESNASKVAFCHLVKQLSEWGYQLIDCQVHTQHLSSLGAEEINRQDFSSLLKQYCFIQSNNNAWL